MLKFAADGRDPFVWINPPQVCSVSIAKRNPDVVSISHVGGGLVHVTESVEKVVEAIEKAGER